MHIFICLLSSCDVSVIRHQEIPPRQCVLGQEHSPRSAHRVHVTCVQEEHTLVHRDAEDGD